MSYNAGFRPEASGLPEHLIPHAMMAQQRPNRSQEQFSPGPYTNGAPGSALLLTHEQPQPQEKQQAPYPVFSAYSSSESVSEPPEQPRNHRKPVPQDGAPRGQANAPASQQHQKHLYNHFAGSQPMQSGPNPQYRAASGPFNGGANPGFVPPAQRQNYPPAQNPAQHNQQFAQNQVPQHAPVNQYLPQNQQFPVQSQQFPPQSQFQIPGRSSSQPSSYPGQPVHPGYNSPGYAQNNGAPVKPVNPVNSGYSGNPAHGAQQFKQGPNYGGPGYANAPPNASVGQNLYNTAPSHSGHRKAPPGVSSTVPEGRRIVSSPVTPQYTPGNGNAMKTNDRTKSLSSTSRQNSLTSIQSNNQRTALTSSHTFSLSSKSRSFSSLGKLSGLSTKKFSSSASLQNKVDRNVSSSTLTSLRTLAQSRKPTVYPAVLSRVAKAFKEAIILNINMKDGLEYHDSFTGKAAVDAICDIIRTNDRNLALLLGRAMDAQKFFHDVEYQHRLRDSSHEVYNFSRVYSEVEFFPEDSGNGSNNNSHRGSFVDPPISQPSPTAPYPTTPTLPHIPGSPIEGVSGSFTSLKGAAFKDTPEQTGVNGVFTILTDCYSPTCTRNHLCYLIACPRRLEQQARLNMKPRGGLKRAVSRLSLHDTEAVKTLWHETVDQSVLDKLDKLEKMRQELIYELIYTERDYVKDLEFMTDFYIMPLRNPANNIIPEREREAFIRTVFGGVSELLRLAKSLSESLTERQQLQKPVIESVGDVILPYVGSFEPFIKYSGNKVFASFEHERQQQVNIKYARFLEAIEKKPESRKQDLSSFLIKGVQRPARYQLLLGGIIKNTSESSPDYKNLLKAKEEIEKVLGKINIQTGESTDRHKVMVLHRLLGRQTLEERYNFKLTYNNRIIYQVTLSRKRDNEKIDLYLFEHALMLVKHKIQNKREVHKVFEKPIYLPLLFVNSGYDAPTIKTLLPFRENGSIISDNGLKNRSDAYNPVSSSQQKLQLNFLGLGNNPVHVSLYADDVTNQNQILLQVHQQQKKLAEKYDIFSLSKYETRRFTGNNRINCAVPCYGGKKLLYGTDAGVWVSTVRSISMTSSEKICSDPTMVISKSYVSQMEVLVEYSKLLVLSDKTLYEFDLSCTDSLDHVKNTRSGKIILNHVSFFKTGVCDGRLLVVAVKSGNARAISIVEPANPFDSKNRNKTKRLETREISFTSDPVSISFLKTKLCIGCNKGFEILSLEAGKKEPILDEADPSLDFATQRESVTPLAIHRLNKNFLLSYSEFSFLINRNGWRTKHEWGIFWEGSPQNIALFYPYLLAFDPGFIEIRDLESTNLIRALVGENIRFLHSNEHEALYACEENGYDIIVSIDFLNLKPKK